MTATAATTTAASPLTAVQNIRPWPSPVEVVASIRHSVTDFAGHEYSYPILLNQCYGCHSGRPCCLRPSDITSLQGGLPGEEMGKCTVGAVEPNLRTDPRFALVVARARLRRPHQHQTSASPVRQPQPLRSDTT